MCRWPWTCFATWRAGPRRSKAIPFRSPFPTRPERSTLAYTLREPVGVAGQIIPWNFPLLMAAWKLGPALASGCTVVLKPAEQTPLSALRLGELIMEAGFPEGVVNIVPGYGETAGAALAAHPDVDKVAFTGSTEVGKLIVHAAAGNLKKVSLELGGKSPNVVFKDADLDSAIPGAASAIFFNHGQCCCAGSRLYVEKPIFDRVVEGVAEHAKKINVGSGLDPETNMGPLVSEEQLSRVCGYLEAGFSEGATAVTGGHRKGDKGYFVEPTVLVNTREDMKVVREEIFGPVVTAMPFDDPEEIMPRANDSEYGLAAAVWTQRHQQSPPHGGTSARRYGVDQLLQHFRRCAALRRIQTIRMGPRNGARRPQQLHADQGDLHQVVLADRSKIRRTAVITAVLFIFLARRLPLALSFHEENLLRIIDLS